MCQIVDHVDINFSILWTILCQPPGTVNNAEVDLLQVNLAASDLTGVDADQLTSEGST